jgi:N-carbamoylputrescine amidase
MIKTAGIQIRCSYDREANISLAINLIDAAVEHGADFICFPELFHLFWFPHQKDKEFFQLAEPIDGETITKMQKVAAEKKVTLICPIFEIDEGLYYNTAVIIGKNGEILGKYRKAHIPDIPLWHEKHYFSPGDTGFPVFEVGGMRFGVLICWDIFFPEAFRLLALAGAQMVFCPTASAFESQHRWETVIRAQAIANLIYIFRVNRVGEEEEQNFYGSSFCTNPYGEMICHSGDTANSIILAEIDLKEYGEAKKNISFFSDRRPDLYGELVRMEVNS